MFKHRIVITSLAAVGTLTGLYLIRHSASVNPESAPQIAFAPKLQPAGRPALGSRRAPAAVTVPAPITKPLVLDAAGLKRERARFQTAMSADTKFQRQFAELRDDSIGKRFKLVFFLNRTRLQDPSAQAVHASLIEELKASPDASLRATREALDRLPDSDDHAVDRAGLIALMAVVSPTASEVRTAAVEELTSLEIPARPKAKDLTLDQMGAAIADSPRTIEANVVFQVLVRSTDDAGSAALAPTLAEVIAKQADTLLRSSLYGIVLAHRPAVRSELDLALTSRGVDPSKL